MAAADLMLVIAEPGNYWLLRALVVESRPTGSNPSTISRLLDWRCCSRRLPMPPINRLIGPRISCRFVMGQRSKRSWTFGLRPRSEENLTTLAPAIVAGIQDETSPQNLTEQELAISPLVLWEEFSSTALVTTTVLIVKSERSLPCGICFRWKTVSARSTIPVNVHPPAQ